MEKFRRNSGLVGMLAVATLFVTLIGGCGIDDTPKFEIENTKWKIVSMTDSQGELGGPYPKELLKFQNGRAYGEWGYAGMDGGNVYSFRGALVSAGQSYYLSPEKEGIQLVCRSCKGVMSITYNKVN